MKRVPLDPNKICAWCGHCLKEGTDYFVAEPEIGTGYCSQECFEASMKLRFNYLKEKIKYPHGTGQTRLYGWEDSL